MTGDLSPGSWLTQKLDHRVKAALGPLHSFFKLNQSTNEAINRLLQTI